MVKNKMPDSVNTNANVVMAFTTTFALIFSAFQWLEINKQSKFIEQQLQLSRQDLLRAHRPWAGISGDIEIKSPLTFEKDKGKALISYKIKNTGNSAAIRLSTHLDFTMKKNFNDFECEPSREFPKVGGATILPNDELIDSMEISVYDFQKSTENVKESVSLYICLQYMDEFGYPHATGHSWSFKTKEGNSKFIPIGVVEGQFQSTGFSSAY